MTNLLNELQFVFVPFVNPDGYEVCVYTYHESVVDAISPPVHLGWRSSVEKESQSELRLILPGGGPQQKLQ